jgi:3-deoxy-D-manno-octulosonate 8-phosphate phosphatase (KDO 8-P phosphatase)
MTSRSPVAGRSRPDPAILAAIEFLLLDVDGVLTDGRVWFDANGHECKQWHCHDAAGLAYWHRAGGRSGFLSGRGGDGTERRARELGIHEVILKRLDKGLAFDELLARTGLDPQRVCYVGDDLVDLPVLRRVGFAVTVPEARPDVFEVVHHVTTRGAGFGAVRDVIETLLQARGKWEQVVNKGGRP